MRKGDNNGVMPSPYGGVKRGEAEHGAMAWLHWQCRGLCPPASVLCVCGLSGLAQLIPPWHRVGCTGLWRKRSGGWSVGWQWPSQWEEHTIQTRKRGGICITRSSSTIKNSSCGDLAIIMYVQAQWVHINFALLWLHTFKREWKSFL